MPCRRIVLDRTGVKGFDRSETIYYYCINARCIRRRTSLYLETAPLGGDCCHAGGGYEKRRSDAWWLGF